MYFNLFHSEHCFEDLAKSKVKNGEKLKDVIQETLTYLDICTEFWNQEEAGTWETEKINSKHISFSRHTPSESAGFLLKSLQDIDEGQANLSLNSRLVFFIV